MEAAAADAGPRAAFPASYSSSTGSSDSSSGSAAAAAGAAISATAAAAAAAAAAACAAWSEDDSCRARAGARLFCPRLQGLRAVRVESGRWEGIR